jgi:hypothetical protein
MGSPRFLTQYITQLMVYTCGIGLYHWHELAAVSSILSTSRTSLIGPAIAKIHPAVEAGDTEMCHCLGQSHGYY